MRLLFLFVAAQFLASSLWAMTVEELTAIHDTRGEPYELTTSVVDDEWRRGLAGDLQRQPDDIRNEVTRALADRFDGARVHIYTQTDTSLVSYIVAFEVDGEIALISWHSVAFFEIPEIVERRVALLDAVGQAFDPARFRPGWAEEVMGDAIDRAHAWADGDRSGRYPGWSYSNRRGIQILGQTAIPDWIRITFTNLECQPRYPVYGWLLQFGCNG